MSQAHSSAASGVLQVGELVILIDGQRATIAEVKPSGTELFYIVALPDGSQQEVEAGSLIRAKTYANWVAPGTDWDGRERRKGTGPLPTDPNYKGQERRQP
jgi:hypothetical protein